MTPRADYKKRLREHLKETKAHARLWRAASRRSAARPRPCPCPGPEAVVKGATGAKAAVQRAAAVAQGPLHAVRGTGQQERMLKNARTEYQDEAEEIATYRAIEALAKAVGDKETAKLARDIGREEKKMADFLVGIIDQLALDVVHDEVPVVGDRRGPGARRTASGRRATPREGHGSRAKATARARATPRTAKATSSRPKATGSRSRATTARAAAEAGVPRRGQAGHAGRTPSPPRARSPRAAHRQAQLGRRERARARLGDDVARAELGAARRRTSDGG